MANIFDTQIANSLLDGDFSIGYQGLVEQEMDILLSKMKQDQIGSEDLYLIRN